MVAFHPHPVHTGAVLELHLTTPPMTVLQSWPFAALCTALGGKALIIELSRGLHTIQPMATFHLAGGIDQVQAAADACSRRYAEAGFAMIRRKIEQDLRTEQAPPPDLRPDLCYAEWHGRVRVGADALDRLRMLCEPFGAHLSRNALRGADRRYLTLRAATVPALEHAVAALLPRLAAAGWTIERERWEAVLFDSNLHLDQGWLRDDGLQ